MSNKIKFDICQKCGHVIYLRFGTKVPSWCPKCTIGIISKSNLIKRNGELLSANEKVINQMIGWEQKAKDLSLDVMGLSELCDKHEKEIEVLREALEEIHKVFDYGEYTAEEMNVFAEKHARKALEKTK